MWTGIKKLARDLALTLYDHPTKFVGMSTARLWMTIFGLMIVVTWYREQYQGIKFSAWPYLVSAFVTVTTAYGLKKWREGGTNAPSNPVRAEGTGDRESG